MKIIDKIAVLAAVAALAMLLLALAGCQSVTRVEFYEPTTANAAYCTPRTDRSLGHGPVRSIEGKSGVPDFSDGKSFNLNVSAFSL